MYLHPSELLDAPHRAPGRTAACSGGQAVRLAATLNIAASVSQSARTAATSPAISINTPSHTPGCALLELAATLVARRSAYTGLSEPIYHIAAAAVPTRAVPAREPSIGFKPRGRHRAAAR